MGAVPIRRTATIVELRWPAKSFLAIPEFLERHAKKAAELGGLVCNQQIEFPVREHV
jgi:hypothetical protein